MSSWQSLWCRVALFLTLLRTGITPVSPTVTRNFDRLTRTRCELHRNGIDVLATVRAGVHSVYPFNEQGAYIKYTSKLLLYSLVFINNFPTDSAVKVIMGAPHPLVPGYVHIVIRPCFRKYNVEPHGAQPTQPSIEPYLKYFLYLHV